MITGGCALSCQVRPALRGEANQAMQLPTVRFGLKGVPGSRGYARTGCSPEASDLLNFP